MRRHLLLRARDERAVHALGVGSSARVPSRRGGDRPVSLAGAARGGAYRRRRQPSGRPFRGVARVYRGAQGRVAARRARAHRAARVEGERQPRALAASRRARRVSSRPRLGYASPAGPRPAPSRDKPRLGTHRRARHPQTAALGLHRVCRTGRRGIAIPMDVCSPARV